MLRRLCCCCEAAEVDTSLAIDVRRTHGSVLASRHHAARAGQVVAEQSILQDRAYWEVTVEEESHDTALAVGVASSAHELGRPLGDGKLSLVRQLVAHSLECVSSF